MMKTPSQWLGMTLLAGCVLVCAFRLVQIHFTQSESATGKISLRVAHWQLEGGVREALDAIAAEYMKIHPKVTISQLPIPQSIYPNWMTTQLVGGTAPDVVEVRAYQDERQLASYFYPLTELSNEPNPYNRGTSLEGRPLRETFIDGMQGGFNYALLEYYAVPISAFTVRLFYNLDLLREITGSEHLPGTYGELIALCKQSLEFSKESGRPIIPIAGSQYNGPVLMNALCGSQTQKLLAKLNPVGSFDINPTLLEGKYWNGQWNLHDEEILSGLRLMREVGQYMQPGFMQLQREDATFYFVQGNAVMISSGTWDATSIRNESPFRVGLAAIPFPAKGDPNYGKNTLGALSEAGADAGVTFALCRTSEHAAAARDFLLFLASKQANQTWVSVSRWLPSVIGVAPPPEAAAAQPVVDGYLPGFVPAFAGPDAARLCDNAMNVLLGPEGSAEAYVAAIEGEYSGALREDAVRGELAGRDYLRRMDTMLGALGWQALQRPTDAQAQNKLDVYLQDATSRDQQVRDARQVLGRSGR